MADEHPWPDPGSAAEGAFAEYLERLGRGESVDFDAFCAERSALAPELHSLHEHWRRLRSLIERAADGGTLAADGEAAEAAAATAAFLAQLGAHSPPASRYDLKGEVARGGMGAILHVYDQDLRRDLAMKVALQLGAPAPARAPRLDERSLGRFLDEAQITGQLDHPGVVPVHELGIGHDGRPYFTMRLVHGRDLRALLELARGGDESWTRTRLLGVILKACEALAYAHNKGVVHRDVKPGNIMVGRFGEVYVMDWGLARVMGQPDRRDIRLRVSEDGPSHAPRTLRRDVAAETPDSPLVTMDGDVVGTPAYMPPEQARGEIERVGPRSDVYSMGAILYELLAGRMPYARPEGQPRNRRTLQALLEGPPQPLRELARDVPAELESITLKAMARDPADRYADVRELARDLASYLEGRVVRAHRTGAVIEFRKWVARNRAVAAALGGFVLALAGGLVASSLLYRRAADSETLQRQTAQALVAERDRLLAESDRQHLDELVARAEQLWPAYPAAVPGLEAWLAEARALIERLPAYRDSLQALRQRSLPWSDDERRRDRDEHPRLAELTVARAERAALQDAIAKQEGQLAENPPAEGESEFAAALRRRTDSLRRRERVKLAADEATIAAIEADLDRRRTYSFAEPADQWQHAVLTDLVAGLEALVDTDGPLVDIESRLQFASSVEERTVTGPGLASLWDEAIAAIGDPQRCPAYGGLQLVPQLGLVPLGPDLESHLWEFGHLQTGELARRGADGHLEIGEETGLVFVLLPRGTFLLGAQADDPDAPHFDPLASPREKPIEPVTLPPLLLSKYEMTQGQWLRCTGSNPSLYPTADAVLRGRLLPQLHPVESVDWKDARDVLARLGLVLPTEAHWEYAARAGTDTPWWTGTDDASLFGAANLTDQAAELFEGQWAIQVVVWPHDDGFGAHGPVGSLRANAFGLHDMSGNVWEWCADDFRYYPDVPRTLDESAFTAVIPEARHIIRGGAYTTLPVKARSANRADYPPETRSFDLGLRPARLIDR